MPVLERSSVTSGLPDPQLGEMVSLGVGTQLPSRLAAFLSALQQMQAMASGSPQALGLRTIPQMQSLGQVQQRGLRDISGRLGRFGTGQMMGEEQQLRDTVAQQLVPMFTSPVMEAIQQLLNLPNMIQMGRPSTGVTSQGLRTQFGGPIVDEKGIEGLLKLGQSLQGLFSGG